MLYGGERTDLTNPADLVFPMVSNCHYRDYGMGGGMQNRTCLCVLPLNVLNEKLFLVLWFWFAFLIAVSGLNLLYRLFTSLSAAIRRYAVHLYLS